MVTDPRCMANLALQLLKERLRHRNGPGDQTTARAYSFEPISNALHNKKVHNHT